MNYNHGAVRAHGKKLGLQYDDAGARMADQVAYAAGLSQYQFDEALKLHASRVKYLFTPSSYTWKGRLALAAYFLGLVKGL